MDALLVVSWVLRRTSCTSSAQRGISRCISAVSSSGELPTISMPIWLAELLAHSGIFRIFTISALSRCDDRLAACPSAHRSPATTTISKPGTPASAIVGVSGASVVRFGVVTASSFSLPP